MRALYLLSMDLVQMLFGKQLSLIKLLVKYSYAFDALRYLLCD